MDTRYVFSVSVLMHVLQLYLCLHVPVLYDGLLTLDVVVPDRIVGDLYPQENERQHGHNVLMYKPLIFFKNQQYMHFQLSSASTSRRCLN